ncbi:MAG: adenylate/guanylate cyclase domain-containing protein [Bacteroidota bacterium]
MQPKVLIIEDNPIVRKQLETILAPVYAELHFTNSVRKAIDLARYMEFAVILTDVHTPDSNGFSLVHELLGKKKSAEQYVILTNSNEDEAENIIKAYNSGAVDYITKPFRAGIVRAKVELFIRLYKKRKRIEHLLLNILPASVSEEIQENGKALPKRFGSATVMFTDFKAFSVKTLELAPVELVNQLDWYFNEFDKIISKYSIEKIKTIGDAYMCVCGVPVSVKEDALQMVMAANEIVNFMEKEKRRNIRAGKAYWELRIGIHTGPLVAGVIGKKKFAYDIWGNTVNIAARLEGASTPGKINISEETYKQVKNYFVCSSRGEIDAKYIGKVKMHFVESIRPEFSVERKGKLANDDLRSAAGISEIQFEILKEQVLSALRNELSDDLYYHGVHHTIDVMNAVKINGREENVPADEQLLLDTAALLHDTGYIHRYEQNEILAVKYAQKILPPFGFSTGQVKIICGIINTTKTKAVPKTLLQKIMNDADYDYLGREDYPEIAETLYKELKVRKKHLTSRDWLLMQIKFLEHHRYYTTWAITHRSPVKTKHLERLRKELGRKG